MLVSRDAAVTKIDTCRVTLAKDDVVFSQGGDAEHWYEIVSGAVRTCRFLVDGHRQLTGFFFNGDVFGLDTPRYLTTAEVMMPTVLLRHDRPSMDHAIYGTEASEGPAVRAYVAAQQLIHLMGHRSAIERLCAFLLIIARKPGASQILYLPMSRADIADHLGLTIHTVSRTMTMLARRGVVALEGRHRVRIIDLVALVQLASEVDEPSPASIPFSAPAYPQPIAQETFHDA